MENQTASQIQTDEEYFQAVMEIQEESVKEHRLTLNMVAFDLVFNKYRAWVIRHREIIGKGCFHSDCKGVLEQNFSLEEVENAKTYAREDKYNIIVATCSECTARSSLQSFDYWVRSEKNSAKSNLDREGMRIIETNRNIRELKKQIKREQAKLQTSKAKKKGYKQIVRVLTDDPRAFLPPVEVDKIEAYKLKRSNCWVAYGVDAEGNQIGDAEYAHYKRWAIAQVKEQLDVY